MQLYHSVVRSWVGSASVSSAVGESTLRNHQQWQLWVSAVPWKRGEDSHPAIFTSFCGGLHQRDCRLNHHIQEPCPRERDFFVLGVPVKRPGSVQCFRVCKMTPRNSTLMITPELQDRLPSDHLSKILYIVQREQDRNYYLPYTDLRKCINVSPKQAFELQWNGELWTKELCPQIFIAKKGSWCQVDPFASGSPGDLQEVHTWSGKGCAGSWARLLRGARSQKE